MQHTRTSLALAAIASMAAGPIAAAAASRHFDLVDDAKKAKLTATRDDLPPGAAAWTVTQGYQPSALPACTEGLADMAPPPAAVLLPVAKTAGQAIQ